MLQEKRILALIFQIQKFKNIRSPIMLKPIIDNLNRTNFVINNLDINLIY